MISPPLHWNDEHRRVDLLDQTRLPVEEIWLPIETPDVMAAAIQRLSVRGAPAIGIAAAYGVVLAVRDETTTETQQAAKAAITLLAQTRPTAVNLFWALRRMQGVVDRMGDADAKSLYDRLLIEAKTLHEEDLEAGRLLGEFGLSVMREGMGVLTHCHAGGVATSGYGTALAPLLMSREKGITLHAFVDETRPLLQGSRITAWELTRAGVDATLITDSMAALVMRQGKVNVVIVGADRIAANGDVANKIGTYGLAVLAQVHQIPFYVSAPSSTIDMGTATGGEIVIEERNAREVTHGFGRQTAPAGVDVYNPAFDVTPASMVTAIITEKGVVRPPYVDAFRVLFGTDA